MPSEEREAGGGESGNRDMGQWDMGNDWDTGIDWDRGITLYYLGDTLTPLCA